MTGGTTGLLSGFIAIYRSLDCAYHRRTIGLLSGFVAIYRSLDCVYHKGGLLVNFLVSLLSGFTGGVQTIHRSRC
jgi:hypothetical protein